MAHSCPECGSICYCGGDIDDICFDDTDEQNRCTHCPLDGWDDDEPLDDSFDEDEPEA
jgi:hypothetical protein